MGIRKIKHWLFERNAKQFEILFRYAHGEIFSVKRICDGVVFRRSHAMYLGYEIDGYILNLSIEDFDEDMINVTYKIKNDKGQIYDKTGPINDICL